MRKHVKRLALSSALLLLAGCAGSSGSSIKTYDLGAEPPKASLPALRAVSVRAAMPFDGSDMLYRLAWRDPGEIAAFGQSRWAAPPAELLRRQLLRALPEAKDAPCTLAIELNEFTQVFSAEQASDAHIDLRAALLGRSGPVAARGVSVSEPNAGPNAAAGAAAFARATDRAVAELARWIAAQPACRP